MDDIWNDDGGITSKGLAVLIVDALISAGLVPRDKLYQAIQIAEAEIEARKPLDGEADRSLVRYYRPGGRRGSR